MKKIFLQAVVLSMVMQASTLYAVGDYYSEKQGQNKPMQTGAGMGEGDMGMMKQNMHKMMEQMKQIHEIKDSKKRKQLMNEHMQSMHKGMQMMRSMGGGMMMGMMDGKQGKDEMMSKGMDNQDAAQRQQMMEQRVDMMQMMMEQMMMQNDMMLEMNK